jgi:hypothetical protein
MTPAVKNLVKAILRLAGERPRLRVAADPARGRLCAMDAHFTFTGGAAITWHGFAEVCSRTAESYGITPLPWWRLDRSATGDFHLLQMLQRNDTMLEVMFELGSGVGGAGGKLDPAVICRFLKLSKGIVDVILGRMTSRAAA